MKKLFSIFTLLLATAWSFGLNAQVMAWTNQIGGTLGDKVNDVAIDAVGNIYVTGEFQGTVDFDPGAGIFNLAALGYDAFVAKYSPAGGLLWAMQLGSASVDMGNAIAVSTAGNVYVTGTYNGTVDFDPGSGTYNLISVASPAGCPNPNSSDIFILKLDSSGNLIWANSVGGNGQDKARTIALGIDESVHITGEYVAEGASADLDPGAGTYYVSATVSTAAFVLKLTVDGNFVWAKQFQGSMVFASGCGLRGGGNYFYALQVDANNSVIVGGTFSSSTDFDPSTTTYTLAPIACNGCREGIVFKLNSNGAFRWATQFGGGHCEVNDIALDASGRTHATGTFIGTVDFNPSTTITNLSTYSASKADGFVAKLNASGAYVWAKQLGGKGVDAGKAITLDGSGNVYSTGTYESTADFNPAGGKYNIISAGLSDVYVSKLSASGAFVWARGFGGTSADASTGICLEGNGVYTTGYFAGTGDFDPLTGIYHLTSLGGNDGFVHKLDQGIIAKTELEPLDIVINAFPNPTSGNITLQLPESMQQSTYILTDVQGKQILSGHGNGTILEIDLSTLSNGLYLFTLSNPTGQTVHVRVAKTE